MQLVVESTKLKAVEDVPLLPLAGQLFEGMEFPTGEVAKKVRNRRESLCFDTTQPLTDHGGLARPGLKRNMSVGQVWSRLCRLGRTLFSLATPNHELRSGVAPSPRLIQAWAQV